MSKGALNTESNKLSRLWMVCCAGWLGRSLPDWMRIASGFWTTSSTERALGVACVI